MTSSVSSQTPPVSATITRRVFAADKNKSVYLSPKVQPSVILLEYYSGRVSTGPITTYRSHLWGLALRVHVMDHTNSFSSAPVLNSIGGMPDVRNCLRWYQSYENISNDIFIVSYGTLPDIQLTLWTENDNLGASTSCNTDEYIRIM